MDTEARKVLQAVNDLEFTGRIDPQLEAFLPHGPALIYFSPVPTVALVGELWPLAFDLDVHLRALVVDGYLQRVITQGAQFGEYRRPDGKSVKIDRRSDEGDPMYSATVDGELVYGRSPYHPPRPDDYQPESGRRMYIEAFTITGGGRNFLADCKRETKEYADATWIYANLDIPKNRLSEWKRDGKIDSQKARPGTKDADGFRVSVLYCVADAVKAHKKCKAKQRK